MLAHLRAIGIRYLRNGWTYKRLLKQLEQTEFYGRQELQAYQNAKLQAYQNAKLQAIVHHCYRHVPYYRDTFRKLGLRPEDIQTRADLAKLPLLDKQLVQENFDRLISRKGIKSLAFPGYTSGSTGTPGKVLRDYHFINFENAAIWRHFITHGYQPGMRRAVFTGRLIVPVERDEPPFWFFNKLDNTLVFSSLHLSPKNAPAYMEELKRFQPDVIAGYPSAIAMLAEYFEEQGETYPIKVVFPGSETVFEHQREKIERVFETDIHDWYGQQERVAAIGQCEHKTYHIIEDYSIVELLPLDGHLEIVGTHLENYKMPLLRYRTGDTVLPAKIDCPCGRQFRTVDRVLGRMGQCIQTPDGRRITVVNYMMQHFENVREAQFVQERSDALTLKLVAGEGFKSEDMRQILEMSHAYISPTMKIDIQVVDAIPRTANGKFLCVVNKMPQAEVS